MNTPPPATDSTAPQANKAHKAHHAALLDRIATRIGTANVMRAEPGVDLSAYELDWRRRYQGHALAVVRPATAEDVAWIVRECGQVGVSIVPQGGNTGLVGGGVPDASGEQVVLSTRRMNAVRGVDAANLTITVEAGCVLQQAQEAAAAAGFWFPLSLAAEGSCTIGGNLATNAGGTQVLRFGNARELCLGIEAVTSDGQIWHGLTGLRKDNTGYDLRNLLIGSEGTLAVITAATMKLTPMPAASMTAMAACATIEACIELLGLAQRRLGSSLTGFEAMNALSLELVARHMPQLKQPLPAAPWTVLLEVSDHESEAHASAGLEATLEAAMTQGLVHDAAVASSLSQSATMWHLRESIPLAQAEEGLNIKHDVSVPVSRIASFCAAAQARLESEIEGCRLVNFGHLGDGNLHFNVQAPVDGDAKAFLAVNESLVNAIVYDAVMAHGGSFSAEHGVGALKVDELEARKDPVALAMMRAIKVALDPEGVLNPGRVLRRR